MASGKHMHEPEHSTITFSLYGSMDDRSASSALRRLGVGLGSQKPGAGGRWIACGLRSDGVVELWPEPDTPGSSEGRNGGSLGRQLDAAGLPYDIYPS